ncbi:MAG: MGMT family protein [Candidatus Colwellbacteria bacterium]|nr:MGMT family protein [Candidatus Colwellbacteria bacterium]
MNSFCEKVYEMARRIPSGRVATYRAVAEAIGAPCAYRAVGNALSKNRDAHVPCHRVVRSDGDIGEYARGREKKKKLLKKEGVFVSKYDRVDARSIARFL